MSAVPAPCSKATGYPIAKVAAQIAIGLQLTEIFRAGTGQTPTVLNRPLIM